MSGWMSLDEVGPFAALSVEGVKMSLSKSDKMRHLGAQLEN